MTRLSRSGLSLLAASVLAAPLLSACSAFSPEQPPVADSTMVQVLTDMHLAAERMNLAASPPAGLRDSIFTRHRVSPREYEAAMTYYSQHPEAYETLYNAVIDSLSALRSSLNERRLRAAPDADGP